MNRALPLVLLTAVLAGCASVPGRDDDLAQVRDLAAPAIDAVAGRGTASAVGASPASDANGQARQRAVAALLAQPLSADAAVRVALLNSPQAQGVLARLELGRADVLGASVLPNPHLSFGRLRAGDEVEIERALSINLVGLITLPWRAQAAGRAHEAARLDAAQQLVRLAADTRRAWIQAVAAAQLERYRSDVRDAALAGAELARRMVRAGNFSALRQAQEQAVLADTLTQLAQARLNATRERERLARLLGVDDASQIRLPERLPDLPRDASALPPASEIESRALRDRLDVRAARAQVDAVAAGIGLTRATGVISALEYKAIRNTSFDNAAGTRSSTQGWEIDVPLPVFDWGRAGNTRAQARYDDAAIRLRDQALRARSEVRDAWHGWRHAHDVALHLRDEVVPLRKFIADETLLRYNGMLLSVWDLLGQVREHAGAVAQAIEAQRSFWLADTDLQLALTGTSPGELASPSMSPAGAAPSPAGH